MEELSANDISGMAKNITPAAKPGEKTDEARGAQPSLLDMEQNKDVIGWIQKIDIGNLTPLEAINKLYELQDMVSKTQKQ